MNNKSSNNNYNNYNNLSNRNTPYDEQNRKQSNDYSLIVCIIINNINQNQGYFTKNQAILIKPCKIFIIYIQKTN